MLKLIINYINKFFSTFCLVFNKNNLLFKLLIQFFFHSSSLVFIKSSLNFTIINFKSSDYLNSNIMTNNIKIIHSIKDISNLNYIFLLKKFKLNIKKFLIVIKLRQDLVKRK